MAGFCESLTLLSLLLILNINANIAELPRDLPSLWKPFLEIGCPRRKTPIFP